MIGFLLFELPAHVVTHERDNIIIIIIIIC